MTRSKHRCKCKKCKEFFNPDYRNIIRQNYCKKPECQKASKADSQRRWLNKPENRNYFRGSVNVNRVREWRKKNPGYGCKKKSAKKPLQEVCRENLILKQEVKSQTTPKALQEVCRSQHTVLIGIIAQMTGQVLQDDIAVTAGYLEQLGQDILNDSYRNKGGNDDFKTSCLSGSGTADSGAVQLGGSPPGS